MLAVQSLGIHQPAFYPSFGEGFEDAFRNVDIAQGDIFLKLGLSMGDKFVYENAIYQVVRARATLAKGDWVKLNYGGATRLGTVAAAPAASKAVIGSSFNLAAGEIENPEKSVPSFVFITSGTGIGQRRRIKRNTASTDTPANAITVADPDYSITAFQSAIAAPDAFGTLPVTGDGLSVICPWEVIPTASANDLAQGVAMGAATSGNFTVILVAGLGLAKCVGSTNALVSGAGIVISGTAATAKGLYTTNAAFTDSTIQAQESRSIVGYAIDAYSGASALRHVWVAGTYAV
jgi:hypothetical protein